MSKNVTSGVISLICKFNTIATNMVNKRTLLEIEPWGTPNNKFKHFLKLDPFLFFLFQFSSYAENQWGLPLPKMLTSEKIVFETNFTNFAIWRKCHVLFLVYSNFYILNHSVNLDYVIRQLTHEVEYIFRMHFLNHKSFGYETCPTNRYKHG